MEMEQTNFALGPNDELVELLRELAAQVGVAVDTIFPWYVQAALISGWATLALIVFFGVVGAGLLKLGSRVFSKTLSYDNASPDVTIPFLAGSALWFLCIMLLGLEGSSMLSKIIVPEHSAMQQMIADLSKLKP